jgi:hypothetical protein
LVRGPARLQFFRGDGYKKRSGWATYARTFAKSLGILRAGEQPPGKERAERMVNLDIIGFLSTKFLPDCCVEHL